MTDRSRQGPRISDDFAARLSGALEQRGLSLQRLQAHLASRGVDVSVATLSYWVNGRSRPTRAKSLVVLRQLERVLEVPPGTLLEATPGDGPSAAGASLERSAVIERAIQEHGIATDERRVPLMVHQIVRLGPDGVERSFEQRILARAARAGADRWALALEDPLRRFEVEETSACRLLRTIEVLPGLSIFEFGLVRPMAAGELVLSTVRIGLVGEGEAAREVNFGISRPMERVVLEARFDGELPRRFWRTLAVPGEEETVVDRPVYLEGGTAQATLEAPTPGQHSLHWQW